MADRVKGKNAVVTGAGSGIGKAVAVALATEGANIVVCDLGGATDGTGASTSLADETVAECKKLGVQAIPQYGSVADWNAAEAMIKACVDNFGRIDILVNVAGIDRARMMWNLSEEDWDIVLGVHLKGTFNMMRHAAPLMREQRYGRIVNTVSEAFVGTVGHVNYGAAKGGIASLTYAGAWELGRYGITVNAICPRAATRMTMGPEVIAGYKKRVESGLWTQERYNEVTHVATADYLAAIPAFLCTDAAAHINGCILGASGANFSFWKPSFESIMYARDWDNLGPWTVDEVEKYMPNLLKDYVNPAPPEEKK
ncbi:MAG: SDR family NAD(P)-dependent oxidoreductase [Dehalococcoidia bacterium]|nr:SDR family NAD(P)-dependent oxidoreductase [Dehalococcoidia bacterium]